MPEVADYAAHSFLDWIETANHDDLIAGLCALTDDDRKRLSKAVAAAHKKETDQFHSNWRLDLAVMATCGWTEVKRMRRTFWAWLRGADGVDEGAVAILKARRPEWIVKLIDTQLQSDWTRWSFVRCVVREGLCPRPESDDYIAKMIRGRAGVWAGDHGDTLARRLRADPALLEDEIWRIFEIDPPGVTLFSNESWYGGGPMSWLWSLADLAADGTIDRGRLLRATHETLRRGIQLRDTTFHMRLIERLDPTAEERAELREVYLDLLAHRNDAVMRFAVEQCARLWNEHALPPADLLGRITSPLTREKKGPAEAALRLMRKIAKKEPALKPAVACKALEAFRHPVADVHEKALDLLEEIGVPQELASSVEGVAPSLRARAAALAGVSGAMAASAVDGAAEAAAAPQEHADRVVTPVRDFTEMIDVMLAVIEQPDDPIELERALDAFSRLAVDRPFDYKDRTAALLQRAKGRPNSLSGWSTCSSELQSVVTTWLEVGAIRGSVAATPEAFLRLRIDEILRRVRSKRSAPMLAMPTHGAWIDPRVFVERVAQYGDSGTPIGKCDLVQALLRLAPEHRDEALASAARLTIRESPAIRYALGGDETPPDRPGLLSLVRSVFVAETPHVVWAAASYARDPFGAHAVSYRWSVRRVPRPYRDSAEYFIDIESSPRIAASNSEWPLSLFETKVQRWIVGTRMDIRHRQTIFPPNPTATFIAGVHSLVDRMFKPASAFTPTAEYLEPLLDPRTPITELAALALALALVTQDADARTMAGDVAIALFGGGRLGGDELGGVYARLFRAEGFLKVRRLAAALDPIARISPAHALACARLLDELLASIAPPGPKDLHHLLLAYREVLASVRRDPDSRLVPLLRSIGGSGKTAKLASALAARIPTDS